LYLYPEESRDLRVRLDYDGELTYCYPEPRREGASAIWSVTAAPDGTLTGVSGRVYPSLFWEGTAHDAFEQTEGFVVEPGEAASFLDEKEVGIDDDFFQLGGDSLAAVHLVNSIKREMSVEVSIQDVFMAPTIRSLVERIEKSLGADVDEGEL